MCNLLVNPAQPTFAQPVRNQVFALGRVARSFAILLLLCCSSWLGSLPELLSRNPKARKPRTLHLIASERQVVTAPVVIDGRVLFRVRGVTAFPAADRPPR